METLRLGSKGPLVTKWQTFLRGEDLYEGPTHGDFDTETREATKTFQRSQGLRDDGIAGNATIGKAMALGFSLVEDDPDMYEAGVHDPTWPPAPADLLPASADVRRKLFGAFPFTPAPTPGNPEGIRILGSWVSENIVTITIPQLAGVTGAGSGRVSVHKAIAPQLLALFEAWEAAGLKDRILSWGGAWAPRFVRGSRTTLSNHASGTAFDLNVPWNGLGKRPALVGEFGSVRELVLLAAAYGFYWGGWYKTRPDGMHFECVKVLSADELAALRSTG